MNGGIPYADLMILAPCRCLQDCGHLASEKNFEVVPQASFDPRFNALEHWKGGLDLSSLVPVKSLHRFEVNLEKERKRSALGWKLDVLDEDHLHICSISEGRTPAHTYNRGVPEALRVRQGDYVIGVNGVWGSRDMMKALMSSQSLRIEVARPELFTRNLVKKGPLNIEIKSISEGASLYIAGLSGSAVEAHCADVQVGDRIVNVNGAEGVPSCLLAELSSDGQKVITFSRPVGVNRPKDVAEPVDELHTKG